MERSALAFLFLLRPSVLYLDNCSNYFTMPPDRTCRKGNRIQCPILVNKYFLPTFLYVLRSGPVDRTLFQRIGATVGPRMMNEIMERSPLHFNELIPRQLLGRRVHINAMLPMVHNKQRYCRVVTQILQIE